MEGDGPLDLVWVPGFISHLDFNWTVPEVTAAIRQLASFSRLIMFDKPGTGLSDPVDHIPTLEERMEDLHAVLDAAGSARATLFGLSEGGPMSMLFAATYPERTDALILYGAFATAPGPDYLPDRRGDFEEFVRWHDEVLDHWGEGRMLERFAPRYSEFASWRRVAGMFERAAASPGMVRGVVDAAWSGDVREVLPTITVPTLVVHRSGDQVVFADHGKFLAEHIPGARYVELESDCHIPWLDDADSVFGEFEEFLTGQRHGRECERALATVLFTDIADSTRHAAELGDARWRDLLARHDALVRGQLERFRGREVKTLGDGFLAAFDGPAQAIRCALAAVDAVREHGVTIRAGVHTGECELVGDDVAGLAVSIGARVTRLAQPGEVLVSGTVKDLVVGSGILFDDRGAHQLRGVPGTWRVFAVIGELDRRLKPPPETPMAALSSSDRVFLRAGRRAPAALRALGRIYGRRARRQARRAA